MPHLLYTAKQPDGSPARGFVDAPGAEAARDKLAGQGLTEILLHQEPAIPEDGAKLAALSAAEVADLARFKLRLLQAPGLRTVLQEVARRSRMALLIDTLILGWGLWTANPVMVTGAVLLAASPFAMAAWRHRHADRYQELLRAQALGDAAKVKALATQLRAISGKTRNMDFDLDVRLAAFQARAGQLPEALAAMEPWRARMAGQLPLFETRLASVYGAAGDRVGLLDAMDRAWALSANDPSRALDLALALARFGDFHRAQTLLDGIDTALIPAYGAGFVLWTRGVCQMRRGHTDAHQTLALAVAEFLKLAQQPSVWTPLAFCVADHALALVAAGHQAQAQSEIGQAWPVLLAHADQPMLQELKTAGLVPA